MPSITITYPAGDGVRFADALGKLQHLVDGNGDPRSATAGECKQYLIGCAKNVINDVELDELCKAATSVIVVPSVDMT